MSATPNRLTRSASKRSANQLYANPPFEEPTTPTRSPKRSKTNPVSPGKTPKSPAPDFTKPVLEGPIIAEPVLEVPSRLNFDYEEAKAHLIKADVGATSS